MERDTAEKLMIIYADIGKVLNSVLPLMNSISDEIEREKLKKPLGIYMGNLWFDLQWPVVKQFPDLDPDIGTEWLINAKKEQQNKMNNL